jgi:hypothetical protein
MTRNGLLKAVNAVLAVLVVTQTASALLAGTIGHEAFEVVHKGGGALLLALIVVHVALNWNWVKMSFGRR